MNFSDKNIAVNTLLQLSEKYFVCQYHSYFESKSESVKAGLDNQISNFYYYLPNFKDFLKLLIEKSNSRLLLNEFFIELQDNYDRINFRDYNYFSKQVDEWNNDSIKDTDKLNLYHKEIYDRSKSTLFEFDSHFFEDMVYLNSINAYNKFDLSKRKYEKTDLTKDFYNIKPKIITKEFLNEYMQLWNKCKSDFNEIVELPLKLFLNGKLFPISLKVDIADIKEFSMFINAEIVNADEWIFYMSKVSEKTIKENFCKILKDVSKKDWGGELNDHFSILHCLNDSYNTSFLFKGPSGKSKFREMKMKDLGKNADQIVRLFQTNADLMLIQHCHQIGEDVRQTMAAFAYKREKKYCIIDGKDTYKLFKAYDLV